MITHKLDTILSYYTQPGAMCQLGEYAAQVRTLPRDVPALVRVLQGLVLHIFWAERYGVKLSEERQAEVQIRRVQPKLERLLHIDPRPFTTPRPVEQRLVGNCRDFALLFSAFLKELGVPARPRCGFGTYFMPNHFEDHWMTEYWNNTEERWVQVDPQLDDLQKQVLHIAFDPLDMPNGQFILAGEAWRMCRAGEANPDDFGIFQWHGWDFIRGNLMRDFLALNKVVVLPWDFWTATGSPVASLTPPQMEAVDRIAALTLAGNDAFAEIRSLYEQDPTFHVPQEWLE
ncbi:MAG: transglutaminase domain-containing protein [Anaerolineaceae bacterium]|nr:transglutaminase domain-containing protein [Anaerolineaceae bacterium]